MPREKLLPLPAEMDVALVAAARAIERDLEGASKEKTNRQFLARFIPVVAQTLGRPSQPFGAQTYQQLLRCYAPGRSPSSSTVQREIEAYRSAVGFAQVPATMPLLAKAQPPAHAEGSTGLGAELVEQYRHEVEFLRRRYAAMEARMLASEAERRDAEARAIEAQAERDALSLAYGKLQESMQALTQTIALTQERAAADNRANMLRVDQMRGETRAAMVQIEEMKKALQDKDQQIRNAETLSVELRMKNSDLQRRLNDATS